MHLGVVSRVSRWVDNTVFAGRAELFGSQPPARGYTTTFSIRSFSMAAEQDHEVSIG